MRHHLRTPAIFLLCLLPFPVLAEEDGGVVVVEVGATGANPQSGVQVGDRVLSCAGGDLAWSLHTPLDLLECGWELAPRGPVKLRVERGEQDLELVVPQGAWRVRGRPVLQAGRGNERADVALALLLEQAEQLHTAQSFERAARLLEKAFGLAADSPRLQMAVLWTERGFLEARHAALELRLSNAERLLQASRRLSDRPLVGCWMVYFLVRMQTEAQRLEGTEQLLGEALRVVRAQVPSGSRLEGSLEGQLADVALVTGDLERAESGFQRAIEILERVAPGSENLGWAQGTLALVAMRRGDLKAAIDGFELQLAIYRARGLASKMVFPLFNLGIASERLGDFHRADAALDEALQLEKQDSLMAARLLGQRGYLHLSWGRLRSAEEYNAAAHRLLEGLGMGGEFLARSFARLGHVARYRGHLDTAEAHYLQALSIYEGLEDTHGVASHLGNLGNLARQRKDHEAALALYSRALAGLQPGGARDVAARPRLLSSLGRTLLELGRLDEAETLLEESLQLKRKEGPETLDVAASLMLLGDLERVRENTGKAQLQYRAALALHSKLVPGRPAEAENQIRLGQLLLDGGDLFGAETLLAQAVASTSLRASGTALAADALYHLARLEVERGNRKKGLDLHRRAVEALDLQWQTLGGSRDARLSWMHVHADYYRGYLELLVEEGHQEKAFDLLQRFRARGLRDILAQRDLNLPRSERAQGLENQLLDLARERESLFKRLEGESLENELGDIASSLGDLDSRREVLLASLRAAAPDLARLKYPAARTFAEIGLALEIGTAMISFSVGREQTVAFLLRRGRDGAVVLAAHRLPMGRQFLGQKIATFRQMIARHLPAEQHRVEELGTTLYEVLLRPLEEDLKRAERLLVIPDGPLHALPFAALRKDGQYLVEWKPLHLAPSATVHVDLERLVTRGRRAVAFGDPTLGQMGEGESQNHRIVQGAEFRRLPATRREVEAIKRVLPPPVETFVGRNATEERVKQLSDVRLVHLASHAVVREDSPLNSALALAQSAESSSRPENGLLYAWEVIEQMHLETSLVTLSACETALGREIEGEGMLGLVWAFHYAGAKSVLASLWSVEDQSTSDFIAALYTALASGLGKGEVLRRAQLQQISAPKPVETLATRGVGGLVPKGGTGGRGGVTTAHPFYWAAFQLYGSVHE